jgi:hypothetical protein
VWAVPSLKEWIYDLGGCPYFLSTQLYSGHHTTSNISIARPVQIANLSLPWPCGGGLAESGGFFRFQPSSDMAAFLFQGSTYNGPGYPMIKSVELTGYWPSNQSTNFILIPAGSYTVAAGDEWGHLAISYFTVAAN